MDFPIIIIWVSPLSFLGASGVILKFYSFFQLNSSKQTVYPRWDTTFCGVTSGAIEDIQVFGVNMSFISLSEVKNFLYFMSAEGTNEIYNFSLHEMK